MCDGGAQYRDCPRVEVVRCTACQHVWEPEDGDLGPSDQPLFRFVGPCPECESTALLAERCDECPVRQLEWARGHSAAGQLLNRILELEFDVKTLHADWSQITVEEAKALRVLDQERSKYQDDERRRMEQEREEKAAVERMQANAGRRMINR